MKTQIKKNGDTMVIAMGGKLDFDVNEPLRNDLSKLIQQSKTDSVPKKIIFDLQELEFVGSCGISSFVQTLRDFSHRAPVKPRYCNVRSEFKKVMQAFDEESAFEFFENEEGARKSFDQ